MDLKPEDNPTEEEARSTARRRRARRTMVAPLTPDERTTYLNEVTRRASPSFDFFLFSLLAGAVMGFGYILDSPYLLLLGTLFAPLMAPVVGIGLGTILGSGRFFGRSLGGFLVGAFLVILAGALAGFVARLWLPMELLQVILHAQLTWPPFLAVGLGAALTTATLVQERYSPQLPSVALAYGLYLPLAASGFGLGSGIPHLWPDGVVLFLIHLSWAVLVGAATLMVMGFRPLTLFGYSLGGVVALLLIVLALGFGGASAVVGGQVALPTQTYTPSPTNTPSPTYTLTPVPPTETPTPSITPTVTETPTVTLTPTPTPVQAQIFVAGDFSGAVLRDAPNGRIIASLFNGSIVEVLGEQLVDSDNRLWAKVYDLENELEGWILQALLVTATPVPPEASATLTPVPPSATIAGSTATQTP